MGQCLICDATYEPFMSFGKMPIANGFLLPEEFDNEFFFELKVGYCPQCHMTQLAEIVEPAMLFHENYAYFSSISVRMAHHFKAFADMVGKTYLTSNDPFVIEAGSNDGILLKNFKQTGIRHLGVEPSANVAQAAQNEGIQTICRFFNEETAMEIRQKYGLADVFLGANVICHIPDLHSFIRWVDIVLGEKGVFIFEEPYLGDIVAKTSFDQIYDEHIFYFCVHSLNYFLAQYNMNIIDIAPQKVHGGSMRYVVARQGEWPQKPVVIEQLAKEKALGLTESSTYSQLQERIYQIRTQFVNLLTELKSQGKRITGYGATSKSTTIINFCEIGPNYIEYISDTTPGKLGKYTPGSHIPIQPYEHFKNNYPDYAVLFAWNHKVEILEKEQAFRDWGGKFIVYVPSVQVLS